MRLKNNVKLHGIRPEMLIALLVADQVYKSYGQDLVITSANDGRHSYTSLHYAGAAVDLRIRYFSKEVQLIVHKEIQEKLNTSDFDVVLESDHIHIEFQPKAES
mgnify:CR=1 FL=1